MVVNEVANDVTMAGTIVGAMTYMFFVAFGGGMGLLCAFWIGYKVYNKQNRKGAKTRAKGVV